MAIASNIGSTSQVFLEFIGNTDNFDTKKLEKVADTLEDINKSGKQATAELRNVLNESISISKVPFKNFEQLDAAARIIKVLGNDVLELKRNLAQMQSLTGLDPSAKKAVAAYKTMVGQAENDLKQYVKGYERSEKALIDAYNNKEKARQAQIKRDEKATQDYIKSQLDLRKQENNSIQKQLSENYKNQNKAVNEEIKQKQEAQAKIFNAQKKLDDARQKQIDAHTQRLKEQNAKVQQALDEAYEKQKKQLGLDARNQNAVQSYGSKQQTLSRSIYATAGKSTTSATDKNELLAMADALGKFNASTLAGQKGIDGVAQKFSALTTKMAQSRAELNAFQRGWEKFKVVFGRVVDALASFWVINAIQSVIVGFGKSLIESNAIMQVSEARLKTLIVSTAKFAEVQKYLQDLTIKTPFDYQQLLEASAQARAFGIDIVRNMEAIADWASATNKDLTETATAFGKIVNYSPRTALLLSTRGLSKPLFDAYVEQYKDREIALRKMIEDNYSGMAKNLSGTWKGMLANLSDVWLFISQKIGEPLFDKFNNGLNTLFMVLKKVNNEWGSFLSFIGSLIANATYFAGMFGLSVGIQFLLKSIPKLTSLMNVFLATTEAGVRRIDLLGKRLAGILAIQAGIGIFSNWQQLSSLMSQRDDLLKSKPLTTRDELENKRQEITLLEKEIELRKSAFNEDQIGIRILQLKLMNSKNEVSILEDKVRLQQRENALIIAQGNIYDNYKLSKIVKEVGLRKELLEVAKQLEMQAISQELIPSFKTKEQRQATYDAIAFAKAKAVYLRAVSGDITPEKAMADLKKQLVEYSLKAKESGNITQDVVKFIEGFSEAINELSSLMEKKPKGNKAIVEYKDNLAQLAEVLKKIDESLYGASNSQSNAFGKGDKLKSLLDSFGIKDGSIADIKMKLEQMYDKNGVSGDNKEINETNARILETLNTLNQLQQLYTTKRESATSFWTEQLNKAEQYNEKIRSIQLSFEDFRQSLVKDNRQTFTQDQLNGLYANQKEKSFGFYKMYEKEPLKYHKQYLDSLKKENEIYKELQKNSQTFGDAYLKIFQKMRKESDGVMDTLAQMSIDFFKDSGKSLISEMIYGGNAEKIDSELIDLRTKLIQIQGEKAGVKFIEDSEVMTLAKINELEQQRANWILPTLEKSIQSVTDKMTDILLSNIAQEAMSGFIKDAETIQKQSFDTAIENTVNAGDLIFEQSTSHITSLLADLQIVATTYNDILSKILQINIAMQAQAGLNLLNGTGSMFKNGEVNPGQLTIDPLGKGSGSLGGGGNIPVIQPRSQRMSTINRNVSNNNVSNNSNQVIIQGPIYGYDDFKKKVGQATKELNGRLVN